MSLGHGSILFVLNVCFEISTPVTRISGDGSKLMSLFCTYMRVGESLRVSVWSLFCTDERKGEGMAEIGELMCSALGATSTKKFML
jgi:hypothetical protein